MAGTSWGQSNRRFNASADFIERIQPLSAILYQGVPDSSAINATCKAYWLFRDPSAGWMLIGNGSGQLWTLDSNLYWVRQDSTEVFGYSFDAMILPGPRKYGGNGLWKSNGALLMYSWSAHEWETSLLSRELFTGNPSTCFYDFSDSSVYQMGIRYFNAMVKKQTSVTDTLYRLDLVTGDWSVIGRFSKAFRECYDYIGRIWPSSNGLLIRLNRSHDAVYVDFKSKTFCTIQEDIVLKLRSFDQTQYLYNRVSFSTDYGIYSMDPSNHALLDSMSWEQILKSSGPERPLIESPMEGTGYGYLFLFGGIGLGGIALWIRWRRKNSKHISEFLHPSPMHIEREVEAVPLERVGTGWQVGGNPLLGLHTPELKLLEVLVEKSISMERLSTQQFNEVLGISHRTVDSQKKIRSEVVRNINRSFNESGYRGEAVQRSRQEDDRRTVYYIMSPDIRIV